MKNQPPKKEKFLSKFYKDIKANLKNPHYLAISNTVGAFCAFLPILGQTYICLLLWFLLKKFKYTNFSFTIAVAWTILTLPIVMPVILFCYYRFGCFGLDIEALSFSEFSIQAKDIIKKSTDWEEVLKNGFLFTVDEIGKPLLVGWGLFNFITLSLVYFLSFYMIKIFYKKA